MTEIAIGSYCMVSNPRHPFHGRSGVYTAFRELTINIDRADPSERITGVVGLVIAVDVDDLEVLRPTPAFSVREHRVGSCEECLLYDGENFLCSYMLERIENPDNVHADCRLRESPLRISLEAL